MSFLIEQIAVSPLGPIDPQPQSAFHQEKQAIPDMTKQAQRELLLLTVLRSKRKFKSLAVRQDPMTQMLIICDFLAILTIKIQSGRRAALSIRLLTPDGRPLTIFPRARRLIFFKLAQPPAFTFLDLKVVVGTGNGEVRLESPPFYFDQASEVEGVLLNTLTSLPQCLQSRAMEFAKEIKSGSDEAVPRMRELPISKLYYYSQFTNVFISISNECTDGAWQVQAKQQKEAKAIAILKNNYVSSKLASGQSLFSHLQTEKIGWEVQDCDHFPLDMDEIKLQKSRMNERRVTKDFCVLSLIKMVNSGSKVQLEPLFRGGFSSILRGTVQFYYVWSVQPNQPFDDTSRHMQVIVKRDLPGCKTSRVIHERKILAQLKNAVPIFFSKYFIVADKDSCFARDLLMEYINFPNLAQYLFLCKQTASLQSKLYLALSITRALYYMQDYRIVHLDLKPENVLLFYNLNIKLIDFGEAYHPYIKNHRPGFTPPYSAPENFCPRNDFTHKNDVFSLGVILHELLFGFAPFCISDDTLRWRAYLRSSIHEYWLWAPEEAMNFGERTTLPILRLMIGKCLSPNPAQRPELEWIWFFLRNCFNILSPQK